MLRPYQLDTSTDDMAYVALYRKYRSQAFSEVVGQNHITLVLQNAIRSGRISHAYLFCGPRGCGKTSTARLLARALNCIAADSPTQEPCGVCEMCLRIRDGASLDVLEMDAASETGIDDVREKIIENAKFAPVEARYKVYIIDEVHDLSPKAFDSLLKTIEEPPSHVIFILATTEAHKVPITIRSRCQRLDFRRGTLPDLVANINRVLVSEGIESEIEAVTAVARCAEGSFRDSLSLLEQVLAFTDGKLTAAAVHESIGTVGDDLMDEIIETILSDDFYQAFRKAGEIVETGKDVRQLLVTLQLRLRDLVIASGAHSSSVLPEVSAARFKALQAQAARFSPGVLLRMLDLLSQSERDLKFTNQHRLILERAFWSMLPQRIAAAIPNQPTVVPAQSAVTPPTKSSPADGKRPWDASPPPRPPKDAKTSLPDSPETKSTSIETVQEDKPARQAPNLDLGGLRHIWPRVIARVLAKSRTAAGIFTSDVTVDSLRGRDVVIGFPDEFRRSRADRPAARQALEDALTEELGLAGWKVTCALKSTDVEPQALPEVPLSTVGLRFDETEDPSPPLEPESKHEVMAPVPQIEIAEPTNQIDGTDEFVKRATEVLQLDFFDKGE